jgi:transposase-like protein
VLSQEPSDPAAWSLTQFQKTFPDEDTCVRYPGKRRWPNGFVCPACGGSRADPLRSRAHTYECRDCRRQTSITAGTLMHRTRLRLDLWFSAAYLTATHPESTSARRLEELLGIPYSTAWLLKQKFRQSMKGMNSRSLDGTVEVSHTELRRRRDASPSTGSSSGKVTVAAAMSSLEIRLAAIPDTEASLGAFIRANVRPGTALRSPFRLPDYRYDAAECALQTSFTFEWLREYLRGRREPLDVCLESFVEYHNNLVRQLSFDDVLGIVGRHGPTTYWDLVGRSNPRQGLPTARRNPRRRKTATGMREDGSGRVDIPKPKDASSHLNRNHPKAPG